MSYAVKYGKQFLKAIKKLSKKYRNIANDYEKLIDELEQNPFQGSDLGGGVRKIRMAISDKNRGKSGGARVITFTLSIDETSGEVTLLYIYDKEEMDSISAEKIKELLEDI